MSGRQASSTEAAVKAYMPGMNIYALAAKFNVAPTTLYRALRKVGIKFKRGNGK